MAQKFTVPITVKQLASAGSDAVTVYVDQDTFSRLKVEAGGRLTWGSGASAGDVNLYRASADVLQTDDTFKTPVLFVDSIEIDPTGATTDQVLKFDGTKFVAATAPSGATSLDGLTDVVITSPEEFQGLSYNGTNWVNSHIPLVSYVRNAEATTLTTGTAVYIFGATGDHATVKRADNNSDTTSSKTIGLVGANITASNNGPVITRGYVDGIDLSVGYAAGDVLWLGENGAFTKTKPTAPDHLVFIGVVVRATNNGIVYVATQNGYELDELHNVSIPSPSPGDFLKYDGSLWVNDQINLGTDTVGNYVSSVTAGTGISVNFAPGEGVGASVSLNATLDNLSDVIVPSPAYTNPLIWNGTEWSSGSQELTLGVPGTTDFLSISATSGLSNSTAAGENFTVSPSGLIATDGTGGPYVNLNANNVTFSNGTDSFMIDPYWGTDGQFLAFTAGFGAGGTWGPKTLNLDDIANVSAATPTTGDVLTYNGSLWTAASVASGGGGGASVTISDTPPASPTAGNLWFESDTTKTYIYYGSAWVEVGSIPTIHNLNDIGDVQAPTPTVGQVLQWNGTYWVPAVAAGGGLNTSTDGALMTMAIGA